MSKYSIDFVSTTSAGEEPVVLMEFERKCFTNREFKEYLILTLLDLALNSYDFEEYRHLTAYVKRSGKIFLTVRCDTERDEKNRLTSKITLARQREKFRPMRIVTWRL